MCYAVVNARPYGIVMSFYQDTQYIRQQLYHVHNLVYRTNMTVQTAPFQRIEFVLEFYVLTHC